MTSKGRLLEHQSLSGDACWRLYRYKIDAG